MKEENEAKLDDWLKGIRHLEVAASGQRGFGGHQGRVRGLRGVRRARVVLARPLPGPEVGPLLVPCAMHSGCFPGPPGIVNSGSAQAVVIRAGPRAQLTRKREGQEHTCHSRCEGGSQTQDQGRQGGAI